ncbi:lysozyme C-like [Galendromus occidentalis]|uniref:lysozyme n=1 Tax=Galendromus occidentalis TaxID=34638 RepID=A0AAJ6W0M9_9ACAR|nr:lysozyme C-like [Galendromus occidentalis]
MYRLIVTSCVLTMASGRIVERCELAQKIAKHTPFKDAWNVKQLVCIAGYVSGFNTSKVVARQNSQQSVGIFQFPSKYFCLENYPTRGRAGTCHRLCSAFKDDNIRDDVECAGIAVSLHGFRFWRNWYNYCFLNPNITSYIRGCGIDP